MTYDTAKATAMCARGSTTVHPLDLQAELLAAVGEIERQRIELGDWQVKCETRSRELEAAREEARRAEQARDEMQRELIEAQRDLADMKDAVAAAFGGHA